MLRVRAQPGIVHARDLGVLGQPLRDGLTVERMTFHPHRERLRAAEDKPGVERSGDTADGVLQERETLAQLWIVTDDRAADDVGVPADVLGR